MTSSRTKTVHLGYEVGTGEPVAIPLRHVAITGQTQQAGKTTTLEALIARSQLRAVTFVTKRGEGSFVKARRIAPYFREQSDWQYVASILEASRGERLKIERAWIIRASKGARTLADVQANVRRELANPKNRAMSADMYLCLDAYLDVVVPQIASVKWASALDLAPGVNAVDLSDLAIEMQHLVIRSAITWVLEREQGVVVVVPEAWKFIPQGRGTPVKLAAEAFIRQGAALGNYLWLDSQDIGGVEKAILRSVPVWLLGVQREANEIKRTLDNIPHSTAKPKPADIATLDLGQFYACWGTHTLKTYVQPVWLSEDEARRVARGGSVDSLERFVARGMAAQAAADQVIANAQREDPKMCEKHKALELALEASRRNHAQDLEKLRTVQLAADQARQRAAAADELGQALFRLLPTVPGAAAGVDVEAIVAKVLARVPMNGGGPIQVTPGEQLRLHSFPAQSAPVLAAAKELRPLAKRVLKLVETVDSGVTGQKVIAERLGRSTGGQSWMDVGKAIKDLAALGFVEVAERQGARKALREKIAGDLAFYQASESDVEAVYQNVLHEIAIEGA